MSQCSKCYFYDSGLNYNYCSYFESECYKEPFECDAFTENGHISAPMLNKLYKNTNGAFGSHLTCESCEHYIGGGDWNLCCQLKYGLCYKDTEACHKYMPSDIFLFN